MCKVSTEIQQEKANNQQGEEIGNGDNDIASVLSLHSDEDNEKSLRTKRSNYKYKLWDVELELDFVKRDLKKFKKSNKSKKKQDLILKKKSLQKEILRNQQLYDYYNHKVELFKNHS